MVDTFLVADLSIEHWPYGTEVVSLVTRWLEQREKNISRASSPVACKDHRREQHTNEAMLKWSDLIYISIQLLGNIRKCNLCKCTCEKQKDESAHQTNSEFKLHWKVVFYWRFSYKRIPKCTKKITQKEEKKKKANIWTISSAKLLTLVNGI